MTKKDWGEVKGRRLAKPTARAGYDRAHRAFDLAQEVRSIREAKGMSQSELARRIGSTQPAIARLEAGGVAPTIDTLERVAAALDVELVLRFSTTRRVG